MLVGCKESDAQSSAEKESGDIIEKGEEVREAKDCPDIMKYRVGKHVFGIPEGTGKFYANNNNYRLPKACGEIQIATLLNYRPYKFFTNDGSREKNAIFSFSVIDVGASSSIDTYIKMRADEKLKQAGVELKSLPIEDGFYKFEFSGNQFLFIATEGYGNTQLGNPLTFYCSPNSYNRSLLQCSTVFPWKGNILVGAGYISTKAFPVSSWPKLYEELREFAESLIIKESKLEE